jgi:2-polyprenyl-6-methoxyphenol hydroxylase-like FAD-dependent oxidoreductase
VYERVDAIREVGAGISLWANAVHALRLLGLSHAIEAVSTPYETAGLRSWRGRILSAPDVDYLQQAFGVVCVVIHRAELHEALLGAIETERVHFAARCTGFVQDENGVIAEFADGRRVRGDVLIGADGLHSVVRAAIHGSDSPTYAGYTAWRAVVSFDTRRVQASESWGYGTRFGQVPMSGNRVYWFATQNVAEGERRPSEKARLRELFDGWHAPVEALIEATDQSAILRNDIYDRPALEHWSVGRVTLLGDAAHPMTPNLGQGACQALEDAVALAQCVAETSDVFDALRSYESRRVPRANALVERSRQVGRIGQVENRAAVWVRNALLRCVTPRMQAKQLARVIGYRINGR